VEFAVPPSSECRQLVTAAAILIDKYRLEVGESTGRIETVSLDHQMQVIKNCGMISRRNALHASAR